MPRSAVDEDLGEVVAEGEETIARAIAAAMRRNIELAYRSG